MHIIPSKYSTWVHLSRLQRIYSTWKISEDVYTWCHGGWIILTLNLWCQTCEAAGAVSPSIYGLWCIYLAQVVITVEIKCCCWNQLWHTQHSYRFVRLEARQWRSTTQASTKRSSRRGLAQRRADAGGGGPPLPVLPVVRRRLHHAVRELHFLRRPLPPPSLLCSCLHACAPKEKKKKKSRRCSNFIHM